MVRFSCISYYDKKVLIAETKVHINIKYYCLKLPALN
uniref:Uncharacterized protein n=1 Tax=Siphoviridae sp. ct3ka12 TaxID=2827771 RepID=A0A8S5SKQ3_9CAUD|nr:MAG TPA: hypothetical protein [Siphoviridae sp. ct3ka12]